MQILMELSLYIIFLVTTVMLIMVPGPSAITVTTQAVSYSSKKAFWGVLGVASADVLFFALSATGIASLILASSAMFTIIKWCGVLYLLYLGGMAFFSESGGIKITKKTNSLSDIKLFSQGFIVQLANPKALIYFSALLPQFVDPNEPIIFQMFLMGLTCLLADIIVYSLFCQLGERLSKHKVKSWMINLINKAAGMTLIITGIKMASLEYDK